jgi:hypothetical protein
MIRRGEDPGQSCEFWFHCLAKMSVLR